MCCGQCLLGDFHCLMHSAFSPCFFLVSQPIWRLQANAPLHECRLHVDVHDWNDSEVVSLRSEGKISYATSLIFTLSFSRFRRAAGKDLLTSPDIPSRTQERTWHGAIACQLAWHPLWTTFFFQGHQILPSFLSLLNAEWSVVNAVCMAVFKTSPSLPVPDYWIFWVIIGIIVISFLEAPQWGVGMGTWLDAPAKHGGALRLKTRFLGCAVPRSSRADAGRTLRHEHAVHHVFPSRNRVEAVRIWKGDIFSFFLFYLV